MWFPKRSDTKPTDVVERVETIEHDLRNKTRKAAMTHLVESFFPRNVKDSDKYESSEEDCGRSTYGF